MVGETEWLAGGDVGSRGAEPQAVTPCRALDVCVEVGTGRPLTAVKAGANPSPSLSFRLNDAAFETGMCRTADIVLDLAAVQGWINARNRPGCCSLLASYSQALTERFPRSDLGVLLVLGGVVCKRQNCFLGPSHAALQCRLRRKRRGHAVTR